MTTRRYFVLAASGVLGLGALPVARAQQALPTVTVYKSPICGCCGEWVKHMKGSGFAVQTHEVADTAPIRRKLGVPDEIASCHTAVVGGYLIEGHVLAADVKRLLREKSKAKGLAVPGLVVGSPGMEQGRPQPYATIAFGEHGSAVFEKR